MSKGPRSLQFCSLVASLPFHKAQYSQEPDYPKDLYPSLKFASTLWDQMLLDTGGQTQRLSCLGSLGHETLQKAPKSFLCSLLKPKRVFISLLRPDLHLLHPTRSVYCYDKLLQHFKHAQSLCQQDALTSVPFRQNYKLFFFRNLIASS